MRKSLVTVAVLLLAAPATARADAYFCDCDTGAASGCVAGDDAKDGKTLATAKKTFKAASQAFATLAPGQAVRFCSGGAFEAVAARWNNGSCTAGNPCRVMPYPTSWGGEARPIVWVRTEVHAFDLEDGGDAEHEEGYAFESLDLRSTLATGTSWAFFLYNDIDDVTIERVSMDGFDIGVHQSGSNACNAADPKCDGKNRGLTIRGCTIKNSKAQGYLGSGEGLVLEDSTFTNNGTRAIYDHNVYVDGEGNDAVIRRNTLYQSAMQADGTCGAVSLVVHGKHDNLTIEGNTVYEDVGKAGQGCWGIAVDPGYGTAEAFNHVTIRGNLVRNVGNLGIGVASCQDCVIEDNVVVHEQAFGQTAIAAPDRDKGTGDQAMDRVTVRNNSIFSSAGGTAIRLGGEGTGHAAVSNAVRFTKSGTCFEAELAAASYAAFDYNACDAAGGKWESTAGALASWQAAKSLDAHSKAVDPGFASPAGPTWDLKAASATSPIVNAGHPTLSAPVDFDGFARDGQPDMGAYEHGSVARDAGMPADAAAPAKDSGSSGLDSGSSTTADAGPASGVDAGAGAGADAGTVAPGADAGPGPVADAGCGCSSTATATAPLALLVILAGLRRRSR